MVGWAIGGDGRVGGGGVEGDGCINHVFVEYRVGNGSEGDSLWVLGEGEGEGGKKEVEEEGWEGFVMHDVDDDQNGKMTSDFVN